MSPAMILAQEGHNVWVGNNRGRITSYKHETLTDRDSAYWDFSFHEMAKYDSPAFVNTVLQHSNASQLVYIGHSQGTT